MGMTGRPIVGETASDSGVRLAEVAAAISLAADLATGQPMEHVIRSCAIATRFADHLGLSPEDRAATYWFSLFMLSGCSSVSFELSKIFGDDIAFRAAVYGASPSVLDQLRYVLGWAGGPDASVLERTRVRAGLLAKRMRPLIDAVGAHCNVNVQLAKELRLGDRVERALGASFAQWDGKGIPSGVAGEEIPIAVRIAGIADVAEVFHRERGIDEAIEAVRMWSGIRFDPALVDAWCGVASPILSATQGDQVREEVMSDEANRQLSDVELQNALALVGDYADLKSPWFSGHSRGVATLTEAAATALGLPEKQVVAGRNAALVHDIGRAGVPNSIWDKAGPLTDDEWERMRVHAYYSDRVLQRSGGLAFLASVASSAHEQANGGGYPRGIAGQTIPLLGRILGCADRYRAMREDRPHRRALSKEKASRELRRMALDGEVDGVAADAVLEAGGHQVRRRPSTPAGLTQREVEVLGLVAVGKTTQQVAGRLGISPKTAGNHIERIYAKAGISSRAEAALFAMQNGLVAFSET